MDAKFVNECWNDNRIASFFYQCKPNKNEEVEANLVFVLLKLRA